MILCLLPPETCESAEELRDYIENLEKYRGTEDWETVQYELEHARLLLKVKEGELTEEQLTWRRLVEMNQADKHLKGCNPLLDCVLVKK